MNLLDTGVSLEWTTDQMDSRKVFDGLLVMRSQAGDRKAMSLLVKRHHERLCRHAYWYTKDMDTARDVVQDCWGIILKKLFGLQNVNVFESWALRIVTRRSLNFIRNRREESLTRPELLPQTSDTEDQRDDTAKIAQLRKAIRRLSLEQQTVLRLFYNEGYRLHEMSMILDVSVGTIKSRLFHAREKLKRVLTAVNQ